MSEFVVGNYVKTRPFPVMGASTRSVLWVALFVYMNSAFAVPVNMSEVPSLHQELSCLLVKNSVVSCYNDTFRLENIPERLVNLYKQAYAENKGASLVDLRNLSVYHPVLLSMIPTSSLFNADGQELGKVVRKYPNNTMILSKIIRKPMTKKDIVDFVNKINKVNLPDESRIVIASAGAAWKLDEKIKFDLVNLQENIIAYIPLYFLDALSTNNAKLLINHMQRWQKSLDKNKWFLEPLKVKRSWCYMMVKHNYPEKFDSWLKEDFYYSRFLEGCTGEEVSYLNLENDKMNIIFKEWQKFKKVQARSLFQSQNKHSTHLSVDNLKKNVKIVPALSPRDLQKFDVISSDFNFLEIHPLEHQMSLPTAKQVLQYIIAQSLRKKLLESDNPELWKGDIKNIKSFAYLINPSKLSKYKSLDLPKDVLNAVDSYGLSRQQAFYLIGSNVSNAFRTTGILGGLPAITFSKIKINELPVNDLSFVLSHVPSGSLMLSFSLLQKIRNQIDHRSTLETLLSGKDPNQFFNLISPIEIKRMGLLETYLSECAAADLYLPVLNLPRNLLSTVLGKRRELLYRNYELWTVDKIKQMGWAILGLTCSDLEITDTVDVLSILQFYNQQRRLTNKPFPKDLQNCALRAVLKYVLLKRDLLNHTDCNYLLDCLEAQEISAVGGYVFAGLTAEAIGITSMRRTILSEIAQLSDFELFPALNETVPSEFAHLLLESMNIKSENMISLEELALIGNFFRYVNSSFIEKIDHKSFRLNLEMLEGNLKVLCLPEKERIAWYNLILKAFGPPDSWSSSTLETLGDFLIVVPDDIKSKIPKESWSTAADTLVEETSYHKLIEWHEEDLVPYYKVCLRILNPAEHSAYISAVSKTVRHFMMGVQDLVNSVISAKTILSDYQRRTTADENIEPVSGKRTTVAKVSILHPDVSTEYANTATLYNVTSNETLNGYEISLNNRNMSTENTTDEAENTYNGLSDGNLKDESYDEINNLLIYDANSTGGTTGDADNITEVINNITHGLYKEDTSSEFESFTVVSDSSVYSITEENGSTGSQEFGDTIDDPEYATISRVRRHQDPMGLFPYPSTFLTRIISRVVQTKNSTDITTESFEEVSANPNELTDYSGGVSCETIKTAGSCVNVGLNPNDIQQMSDKDLVDCFEVLGSLHLNKDLYSMAWEKLKKQSKIIPENFQYFGKLVTAMKVADLHLVDTSPNSDFILENLHLLGSELNDKQVISEAGGKLKHIYESSMSIEVAASLGHIWCELTPSFMQNTLKKYFLEVSPILGKMKVCHIQCFDIMIKLAKDKTAYGPVESWTAEDVSTLGVLMAGLSKEDWKNLTNNEVHQPTSGLMPSAIKCLPPERFQYLSDQQISSLNPMAAAMISKPQVSLLSESQKIAVSKVQNRILDMAFHVQKPSFSSNISKGTIFIPKYVVILLNFVLCIR